MTMWFLDLILEVTPFLVSTTIHLAEAYSSHCAHTVQEFMQKILR